MGWEWKCKNLFYENYNQRRARVPILIPDKNLKKKSYNIKEEWYKDQSTKIIKHYKYIQLNPNLYDAKTDRRQQ